MRTGYLLLLLLSIPSSAFAIRIEYATDRASELVECDRAWYRGRRAEALNCYRALLASNDDVRIKAEAARALGDQKAANGFFQSAIEQFPEDAAVRTRWAELFVETHQDNEAVQLYQESLAIDAEYVPALVGLAGIAAGRFESKAREWIEQALDISAEDIAAHLLLARMDLEEGSIDAGEESLDKALEIANARDVAPVEIYALKAAVDLLRGVEDSSWTARALEYNPGYGEAYATPAHFYVITRRYREAIELYRSAVEVQPDLYTAHAELGTNLLRENKMDEAQRHLALAYRGDPYSVRVVNSLRLIDSFDNFDVTEHENDSESEFAAPGVILRLHRDESAVIESYVLDLVKRTVETFTGRYGFELEEPVIVELYPEHDDFAVRTSGLPGIGLLGVTFGYLVAMDSPSGRGEGEFHWGTTLWHEMAHVFTLEATGHLVPRWFSEGVSVWEEWSTGPLPGRHLPMPFFQAMTDEKLLPITELDRGFIRPTYDSQVIVSYMQAGLICEFIATNWGQQALEAMLDSYAAGQDTATAVEAALGVAPADFDAQFHRFLEAELGPVRANLEPWQAAQRDAHEAAGTADWAAAAAAATRAVELYPDYVDEGSAYLILARAQEEQGRVDAARATLGEYHRRGGYSPSALMQLAEWQQAAGEKAAAIAVLEDLILVAPLDEQLHTRLGDWLLEGDRPEQALAEYQVLAAMQPHDQAAVHLRLAKAYLGMQELALSREHLLYALEIAPHYREAQQLLLEIVR